MRSLASEGAGAGCASAASAAEGGGVAAAPRLETPTRIAASAARLAKRLTRLRVEEVRPCNLDGDRHRFGETHARVRRELRDEVRARSDDAVFAHGVLLLDLRMLALPH